MIDLDLRLEVV